jgi:hypothetical protein
VGNSLTTTISACDNLFLDGSLSRGSGGRRMKFVWSLVEIKSTDSIISSEYISASLEKVSSAVNDSNVMNSGFGHPTLQISSSLLHPGLTYKWVFTVTNFLNIFKIQLGS